MNLFVGASALVLVRPPLFGILAVRRKEQLAPCSPSTCSQVLKRGPLPAWGFVRGAHPADAHVV